MALQLWFLRHGEAEPHDARPDVDRRLTPRGAEQSRSAGQALAALGLEFQIVATSPKVRALDTARLACEALRIEPVVHEPLAEGFDVDDALALADAAGDARRILLVGHNPDLEDVVRGLTGGTTDLKKGGVAGVRMRAREGELIAVLRPRELARIR